MWKSYTRLPRRAGAEGGTKARAPARVASTGPPGVHILPPGSPNPGTELTAAFRGKCGLWGGGGGGSHEEPQRHPRAERQGESGKVAPSPALCPCPCPAHGRPARASR